MLAFDTAGSGPRIVLLHGFTQTRRCWAPLDADLAADHQVVRVDLPGHGDSAAVAAGLDEAADLITEIGGVATYLGYSMGARHALVLAARHPDAVAGLVLISGTDGIADPAEREARRRTDEERAARVEAIGADAFVTEWLNHPPFARVHDRGRFEAERRANTTAGLATSLRRAGTGGQEPLGARLAAIGAPTLVVAGAEDPRYVERAEALARHIGDNARRVVVAGAGHAPHHERPDAFVSVLRDFLADHDL